MRQHFDAPAWAEANHVALSPLSFLKRAEIVHATRSATTCDDVTHTWGQVGQRCRAVAAALTARGIGLGDCVSVLAANGPELFELHYAVPLTGANEPEVLELLQGLA